MLTEHVDIDCETVDDDSRSRNSSTRSCPGGYASASLRAPRRSLRELRIDVGRNLEPIYHRNKPGLERITEAPSSPKQIDDTPIAPPRASRARMSTQSLTTSSSSEQSHQSVAERIEKTLNTHYYTIAYSIVIIAYLIGFTEYLFFRLFNALSPNRHNTPQRDARGDLMGKDGFHYGVSIAAFIVIALFQLICFFALTISENWITCKEPLNPNNELSKKRHELAAHIRQVISQTMYRTFLCYGICSFINIAIIFYMVAIQDGLNETVTTVFLAIFDVVAVIYFVAFPLTTIVYHPHMHCFRSRRTNILPPGVRVPQSQSATLETTVSQDELAAAPRIEEYSQSPRRIADRIADDNGEVHV